MAAQNSDTVVAQSAPSSVMSPLKLTGLFVLWYAFNAACKLDFRSYVSIFIFSNKFVVQITYIMRLSKKTSNFHGQYLPLSY